MRLFAALPLDDEGRKALTVYRRTLEELGVRGNFTRSENLHITLAFLGEQPDWRPAADALEWIEFAPFRFTLDRLDTLGRGSNLVLCPTEEGGVRALAGKVETTLREAGFGLEKRRFRAHVTLCRELRAPQGTQLPPPPAVVVAAEEFKLYLSHRPEGRLTYTPLWTKKLHPFR